MDETACSCRWAPPHPWPRRSSSCSPLPPWRGGWVTRDGGGPGWTSTSSASSPPFSRSTSDCCARRVWRPRFPPPSPSRARRGPRRRGRARRGGSPEVRAVRALDDRRVERFVKAALDRVGAGAGLLLCAPLLAGLALLVRLSLGRPVLFRQRRPGRHGAPFELVKFRTMRDGTGLRRRSTHRGGTLAPRLEPGRAARAAERPPRRDELRGTAAAPRAVPRSLYPRAGAPAHGKARDHRLGAGPRPQRPRLGGASGPGRLVRGPLVAGARSADPGPHRADRGQPPRGERAGVGDGAGVRRRQGGVRGAVCPHRGRHLPDYPSLSTSQARPSRRPA